MPVVFVPPMLKAIVPVARVPVRAWTVGEIIEELEARYPGVGDLLIEDDEVMAGIAVIINDQVSQNGLMDVVVDGDEVHFLPALSGG